ncbi:MAG: DNA cytosine methyltransferase [Oscillospiraceae bacterium]|nr:DNA cytosine methyltransferase [Oscillospiraceae bacterium]
MGYKLGSLFDGIAGFPLVGSWHNLEPVWASEISEKAVSVTKKHFPNMKHLGDITKLKGSEIKPVDVITFGSPCTNLSIAGNRKGLLGEESKLFYEAVRIIEEMRKATNNMYPRFAVWENVVNAFSSNNGDDFKCVIDSMIRIMTPDFEGVDKPSEKNLWRKADGWLATHGSVCYRVLNAQYWGVPQHRERIFLVADFRGGSAGKILFDPESEERALSEIDRPWHKNRGEVVEYTEGIERIDWVLLDVPQTQRIVTDKGVIPTLCCKGGGGSIGANLLVWREDKQAWDYRMITPLEGERLQGFPDNWTEYGENGEKIKDTDRYTMIGNSVALPCVDFVLGGIAENLGKGC